jgi:hypothetical protein
LARSNPNRILSTEPEQSPGFTQNQNTLQGPIPRRLKEPTPSCVMQLGVVLLGGWQKGKAPAGLFIFIFIFIFINSMRG